VIPEEIFQQMRDSKVIRIEVDRKLRMENIYQEYISKQSQIKKEEILSGIMKIKNRLGGELANRCVEELERGNYEFIIDATLSYYDKTYEYGLSKRDQKKVFVLKLSNNDLNQNTFEILNFYDSLKFKKLI
jgi:tRNA 2-selenouridine synthase